MSVEGESRCWQTTTPLADELKDVLTLWAVTGLQGKRNTNNNLLINKLDKILIISVILKSRKSEKMPKNCRLENEKSAFLCHI